MPKPTKKILAPQEDFAELTADLQRVQADFINYRNRIDEERKIVAETAKAATILKLLPVIDNIELATKHMPTELKTNKWAQGVTGLSKSLEKSLAELGLTHIAANPGTLFDPNLHEAVIMEDSEGNEEIISEELRPGYQLGAQVARHSLVKVRHQSTSPEQASKKIVGSQPQSETVDLK